MQYGGSTGRPVPGPFNSDPRAYLPAEPPVPGTAIPSSGFAIMDPEFKMPQTWKASLAVDVKLPFGFVGSVEGVYNKDINVVVARNMGLVDPVAMNIPGYSDNRMMYPAGGARFIHRLGADGLPSPTGGSGAFPLMITNVSEGTGYYGSLTFMLERPVWRGVSGMVAYTRSWAKSLNDGSGDQAASMWNLLSSVNGHNTPELGFSSFVPPNSLIGAISYRYRSFTTSVFYNGSNNGRASYTYANNIVRDGGQSNNLLYVPKDASDIIFVDRGTGANLITAQAQSDAFFAYIEQDPYLRTRKGQYAERGGLVFPWTHMFDIKFTQDFNIRRITTVLEAFSGIQKF
jgi:hypothetical protein